MAPTPAPTFVYESGGPKADASDIHDLDGHREHRAASVPPCCSDACQAPTPSLSPEQGRPCVGRLGPKGGCIRPCRHIPHGRKEANRATWGRRGVGWKGPAMPPGHAAGSSGGPGDHDAKTKPGHVAGTHGPSKDFSVRDGRPDRDRPGHRPGPVHSVREGLPHCPPTRRGQRPGAVTGGPGAATGDSSRWEPGGCLHTEAVILLRQVSVASERSGWRGSGPPRPLKTSFITAPSVSAAAARGAPAEVAAPRST